MLAVHHFVTVVSSFILFYLFFSKTSGHKFVK